MKPLKSGEADRQTALRILWVGAVGMVVVLSCLPPSSPVMEAFDGLPVSDKVEHLGAYLVLAFIPALHEGRRTLGTIGVSLVVLGVALEFCQTLVAGRSFEVSDMIANAIGVVVGITLGLAARARFTIAAPSGLPEF